MILTLIGMSNCGKTYWSKKLEEIGFTRFSCDDLIESKLEKELKNLGYSGIADVAKWMGQPFESQYRETSKKYLAFEKESLSGIIQILSKKSVYENIVVDSTGSVIYAGDKIMEHLRSLSIIVYLDTPEEVIRDLGRIFFKNPKPVIWGDKYIKREKESDAEALKRCYPSLLNYRCKEYRKYAYIELNYFLLRKPNFTVDDFLMMVQKNDSLYKHQRR